MIRMILILYHGSKEMATATAERGKTRLSRHSSFCREPQPEPRGPSSLRLNGSAVFPTTPVRLQGGKWFTYRSGVAA